MTQDVKFVICLLASVAVSTAAFARDNGFSTSFTSGGTAGDYGKMNPAAGGKVKDAQKKADTARIEETKGKEDKKEAKDKE
ncbi:MAG: hypothetical protein EBV03_02460 [Proteobacteria bacterium]|nr:hypothetical protein [Pseudomonadota bacterium]